ncbi:MAG: SAM-dependent chlorinase/fluorinase [Nitrospiraceae bacterium]|nr:SAM-dependent chlorinase/fluorinase [Nitrospiraceae bacterium]
MPTALSLITLLTDFGDRDYFVASMKGVILGINPQAQLIDLSHQVTAHDVQEAAYLLKSCYRYFPDGTVHMVVVDPGVGTTRRPILVATERHYFIGPDNGLFTHIYAEANRVEVREIENRQFRLDAEGATFDGRDLFAPAAAWLTRRQPLSAFGRIIEDYERFALQEPRWTRQVLQGAIVHVDRFGNLISNLTAAHVQEVLSVTKRETPEIRLGGSSIYGLVRSYGQAPLNGIGALINSNGQVEVFCREGRASDRLGLTRGAVIKLA